MRKLTKHNTKNINYKYVLFYFLAALEKLLFFCQSVTTLVKFIAIANVGNFVINGKLLSSMIKATDNHSEKEVLGY